MLRHGLIPRLGEGEFWVMIKRYNLCQSNYDVIWFGREPLEINNGTVIRRPLALELDKQITLSYLHSHALYKIISQNV